MEEEIEYFKDVIRISEEQKSALQNSNTEIVNKLIHEKQKIMEQIDRIEKRISPARKYAKK
jgi:flagellar biosynthesis/type III secretory pathway chaperone